MSKEIVNNYGKSIRDRLWTSTFSETTDERIVAAFREICSVPCKEDGVKYDVEHC